MKTIITLLISLCSLVSMLYAQPDKDWSREGKKLALIIGNANYPGINTLCFRDGTCPPVNDADDLDAALKSLGFEVLKYTDLSKGGMEKALDEFGTKLRSGDYVVALAHFSGHGSEVKGTNYIYPVDASPLHIADVSSECIDVNAILGKMDTPGLDARIVLLDACRSNPYEKAWSRYRDQYISGLGYMTTPSNTFVGFAARPGAPASNLSYNGRNGLYTEAILKHIKTPNLSINDIFTMVGNTVVDISNKHKDIKPQEPVMLSNLTGILYFKQDNTQVSRPLPQLPPVAIKRDLPAPVKQLLNGTC